ncbi:hypothetical protein SAMN06296052_13710 [Pontibacter ummariensis]|uniref:Uncharacterized protein n=1 Tax=Pontibacter ummariensis TaxID=1610492 RepID=A0A239L986_9BACT|nr:hypothetical protein SAMN06296052_13710 [Pontibacter ummariensis]
MSLRWSFDEKKCFVSISMSSRWDFYLNSKPATTSNLQIDMRPLLPDLVTGIALPL